MTNTTPTFLGKVLETVRLINKGDLDVLVIEGMKNHFVSRTKKVKGKTHILTALVKDVPYYVLIGDLS